MQEDIFAVVQHKHGEGDGYFQGGHGMRGEGLEALQYPALPLISIPHEKYGMTNRYQRGSGGMLLSWADIFRVYIYALR